MVEKKREQRKALHAQRQTNLCNQRAAIVWRGQRWWITYQLLNTGNMFHIKGIRRETERDRERDHLQAITTFSRTHAKEKIFSMVVDSHFPRSKSAKCMEIVSNPTIMDVSHTTGSYGPSSVLLAVITLLLWRALSAAEIGKAHSIQALAAIHIHVCIQKSGRRGRGWWLSVPEIYDLQLPSPSGDGQHNAALNSLHSKERWKALA